MVQIRPLISKYNCYQKLMMNSLIKMLYLQVYLMGMVPHYEILMSWKINASEKYTYGPIFNTGICVAESLC